MRRLIRWPFRIFALIVLTIFAAAFWIVGQLYEGVRWAAGVLRIPITELEERRRAR